MQRPKNLVVFHLLTVDRTITVEHCNKNALCTKETSFTFTVHAAFQLATLLTASIYL